MKTIILPQLRQTYWYDCWAKALQAALVYYGIQIREDHIMQYANTSEDWTPIQWIIKTAHKYGLKTDSKSMTIDDIKQYLDKNIPVIIVLQAWAQNKKIDWENDWIDWHYVVAIGYTKDKIFFEDPSSFERTYLKYDELQKRWHDIDTDGKKYFNHGIAIFGKKPNFDKNKIIHME